MGSLSSIRNNFVIQGFSQMKDDSLSNDYSQAFNIPFSPYNSSSKQSWRSIRMDQQDGLNEEDDVCTTTQINKKEQRRRIERVSQKKQRQKKRDQKDRLVHEINQLSDRITQKKLYNKQMLSSIGDLRVLLSKVEQLQGQNLHAEFLLCRSKWINIYSQLEQQFTDDLIQNLKLVEVSVLYITFIDRLKQCLTQYEVNKDKDTLEQIQNYLNDFIELITRVLSQNKQIKENVLFVNFQTLKQSSYDDKQILYQMLKFWDTIQVSQVQQVRLHDIMEEHMNEWSNVFGQLLKSVYHDVRQIASSQYNAQSGGLSTYCNFDILKEQNRWQIEKIRDMALGTSKGAQMWYYHKGIKADQLARLYIMSYPYIPNIHLMVLRVYAEIETRKKQQLDDFLQGVYLHNFDFAKDMVLERIQNILKIE